MGSGNSHARKLKILSVVAVVIAAASLAISAAGDQISPRGPLGDSARQSVSQFEVPIDAGHAHSVTDGSSVLENSGSEPVILDGLRADRGTSRGTRLVAAYVVRASSRVHPQFNGAGWPPHGLSKQDLRPLKGATVFPDHGHRADVILFAHDVFPGIAGRHLLNGYVLRYHAGVSRFLLRIRTQIVGCVSPKTKADCKLPPP